MTPLIEVRSLGKRFGGIVVADAIDLDIRAGEVLGLIGPNGAGKTSLFNLISGAIAPDQGTIKIAGVRAEGLPMYRRARLGVARTWQMGRLFSSLSLLDNLLIASRTYPGESLSNILTFSRLVPESLSVARQRALILLERVGLIDRAEALPTELSYGQQKLLGLARALMNDGDCVLLDEPMAGVEGRTYDRIVKVVREEAANGKAMAVVEHNISFIREVSDRAVFMFNGRVIAEGSVSELTADKRLTEIYFGGQA